MDFLNLKMLGMINRLSVSIVYKPPNENEEVFISFGEAIDWWQKRNTKPFVGFIPLSPEVILPGLLFDSTLF
jgi:hypothetical protein